jgi:hypothetical protein
MIHKMLIRLADDCTEQNELLLIGTKPLRPRNELMTLEDLPSNSTRE